MALIVQVSNLGGPYPGSFFPAMAALGRALRDRGDRMALVARAVSGATWYDAVREAGVDIRLVDSATAAARAVRELRPAIAHVHFSAYAPAVTAALWPTRARVFWHIHSGMAADAGMLRYWRGVIRHRLFGLRIEKFVCVSSALAEQLATWGAAPGKIAVVTNGIDVSHFRPPTAAEREAAREALGVPRGAAAVVFFGWNERIKGGDVLLEALAAIPSPPTVIAIKLDPKTRAAFHQKGLPLLAFDRLDDVRSALWSADALVLPSREEGALPFAVLESLAAGTPVIASDLPTIRQGVSGLADVRIVPRGDAHALAAALGALPAVTGDGRDRVVAQYGNDLWTKKMCALYDQRAG